MKPKTAPEDDRDGRVGLSDLLDGILCDDRILRDVFAGLAMQALIAAGGQIHKQTPEGVLQLPARVGIPPLAYEYADAMLAQRKIGLPPNAQAHRKTGQEPNHE